MKREVAKVLGVVGLLSAARALLSARSVILTYHGVLGHDGSGDDFLNHNFIAEEVFDSQLQWLRKHYRPLALSDLIACYREGRQPPPRSVALTFDDGFENNYSVAFPLLRQHGIPFTVFLTTGLLDRPAAQLWSERVKRSIYLCSAHSITVSLLGRDVRLDLHSPSAKADAARGVLQDLKRKPVRLRDAAVASIEAACGRPPITSAEMERYAFLTWEQVRTMASAGVEFGSHTVSHPILSTLDTDSVDFEVRESKRCIESQLNRECETFAFPNGSPADYGQREKRALESAGYHAAFSLRGRLNGRRPDIFEIDRINVGRQLDTLMFETAVIGALGFARRARQRVLTAVHRLHSPQTAESE